MKPKTTKQLRAELRNAFADYLKSEGCGCCEAEADHEAALARISQLLNVRKFADESSYDYTNYETGRVSGQEIRT